jgi:hypothetical protein
MGEKVFKVRLRHPLNGSALELELPASLTFGELLKLLYDRKFIERKAADYAFIIDGRLCALNKSLSGYIPPETADTVEIEVNGLLSIMS